MKPKDLEPFLTIAVGAAFATMFTKLAITIVLIYLLMAVHKNSWNPEGWEK